MGYCIGFTTQAAVLLDQMADAERLLGLICRAIYNPMYEPYIVPEISAYDQKTDTFIRMGDLGNGVQQAEIMKLLRIMVGIDDSHSGQLRILPRMPFGWTRISADRFPVQIGNCQST